MVEVDPQQPAKVIGDVLLRSDGIQLVTGNKEPPGRKVLRQHGPNQHPDLTRSCERA